MAEVELRVTADLDQATKEVVGFRREYAELVKQVEKPLRQTNATRDLEQSLAATGTQVRVAKQRLSELQAELIRTDHPTERLKQSFKEAAAELQRLQRVEATQSSQLNRMRAELKAAGVDTTRLAAEQRRLNAEMSQALGAGRADAAARSIRDRAAALQQQAVAQRQANIEAARENLGISRYRAIQVEIQRATQQYDLLRRSGKLTTQELAVAQQQLAQRIRESKDELRSLNAAQVGGGDGGIAAAIGSRLGVAGGAAAGVGGAALLAAQYAAAVDPIKKMEAQLRLATKSQEEFTRAQAETYRIAQQNQAPLGDVVTLYSRLAPALRDVGRGQGDTIQIIEAVTKSLRISGATAQETASTIQQFSQALGSGVLRGEEFNALAEASPRLLQALADGLQVNVGALRAMAAEGQLTADVIADSLIGQLSKLTEEAALLPDTFGGAMIRLTNELQAALGKFDKLTGASDRIIGKINALADAVNKLASGDLEKSAMGAASFSNELARMIPLLDLALGAGDKALESVGLKGFAEAAKEAAEDEAKVYDFRAERLAAHNDEMRALRAQAGQDTKAILDQQVKDTKAKLTELVAAERKAAGELEAAKKAQLDTQKRYQEALASLNAGPAQEASYGQASALKAGARQALQQGDVEEAKRQAQAALAILQELAAAGENTFGFGGFIKELQAIEESADASNVEDAQAKLDAAKASALQTKAALEELKDIKVAPTLDAEAQQKLLNDLANLAKQAGVLMTIPATVTAQAPQGGPVDPAAPAGPGFSDGGWTGPGTKHQPAGVVHADEHVQPKRVVREPGALSFLEHIRRGGFRNTMNTLRNRVAAGLRGYAEGGLVAPRLMPSIPPLSPALTSAPGNQYLGDTTLVFPGGESLTVSVPASQEDNLKLIRIKHGRTTKR